MFKSESIKRPLLFAVLLASLASCRNALVDGVKNPELPPYTDTGANTVGCLVNGAVLIPQGRIFSMILPLHCRYGLSTSKIPGFSLSIKDDPNNKSLLMGMSGVAINRDTIIHFGKEGPGSLSAYYYERDEDHTPIREFETIDPTSGEMSIRRFDPEKRIISGTFWLDAVEPKTGAVLKVRDGRFDMKYSDL